MPATRRLAATAEGLEGRVLLSVGAPQAIAPTAMLTDHIKAAAKPAPPPPTPTPEMYQVLKIADHSSSLVAPLDNSGRTAWATTEGLVIWTPTDSNGDGIWDGGTSVTLPMPSFESFGMTRTENDQTSVTLPPLAADVHFGPGGAVSAMFNARVYQGTVTSDNASRVFVYVPTTGPGGQLSYGEPVNLGRPDMTVPAPENEGRVRSTVQQRSFEPDGTVKGFVQFTEVKGTSNWHLGTYYFRLIPQSIDGKLVWSAPDTDINTRMELRPETVEVDEFGREYAYSMVSPPQLDVILPDETRAPVYGLRVQDSNTAGRIAGTTRVETRKQSTTVACYIDGIDTNGDGKADTWYRDVDGVAGNDLIVHMGLRENLSVPSISAINEHGVAVGHFGFTAYRSGASPATMWRDAVAIDLKTIASVPGIFTLASDINDNGVIRAVAYYDGVYTSYLLVPPPVKAATTSSTTLSEPVKLAAVKAVAMDVPAENVLLQSSASADSLYDLPERILA